eukprot:gb/GECG01013340.1/.p1 GENE.gb/GECG01013340.1/~~gb/GECG01013340.1/.p1  ORF type:complete len:257 (+),score=37.87 gb/GECG01013340.1/:1-771(+)
MSSDTQRRPWIGGNWKCSADLAKVRAALEVIHGATPLPESVDIVVAPSHIHIGKVMDELPSPVQIAAQNIHSCEGYGAFTGEHSAEMLKDFGVNCVIVGHSERRHIFKESDEEAANKAKVALKNGMHVVFCIGETLDERDADKVMEVNTRQLKRLVDVVEGNEWERIVIAYEPVWAIGTGRTATADQAQEVHSKVREWIAQHCSQDVANKLRIVYGGSVKSANCDQLIAENDIDGFLVGGASLKPDFADIIKAPAK